MLVFSEETPFQVEHRPWVPVPDQAETARRVFWMETTHTLPSRLGLVVLAGSRVVFEPVRLDQTSVGLLVVGAALPQISPDGLDVHLSYRVTNPVNGIPSDIPLATHHVEGFEPEAPWVELRFPLEPLIGTCGAFVIECGEGPEHLPSADWLAVYEFVVSPENAFRLNRARSFAKRRARIEIAFFTRVYSEVSIYQEEDQEAPASAAAEKGPVPVKSESAATEPGPNGSSANPVPATKAKTNAYFVASCLLLERLGVRLPDFRGRLAAKLENRRRDGLSSRKDPLRILSLCSGAARIEKGLVEGVPAGELKLTLLDLNPSLLEMAKKKFARVCEVDTLVGNVNHLDLQGEQFDIIVCASGLHHVVELERLTRLMAKGLRDGGEFWSIGEYVGQNGNRLWPSSYAVANEFFRSLPEQYRLNHCSGAEPQLDIDLPNQNCSLNCFEGIRSEDIEACLQRYFEPVEAFKINCFNWRLFNASYVDNYDTEEEGDLEVICEAVKREMAFYRSGGIPVELNGIYGKWA